MKSRKRNTRIAKRSLGSESVTCPQREHIRCTKHISGINRWSKYFPTPTPQSRQPTHWMTGICKLHDDPATRPKHFLYLSHEFFRRVYMSKDADCNNQIERVIRQISVYEICVLKANVFDKLRSHVPSRRLNHPARKVHQGKTFVGV